MTSNYRNLDSDVNRLSIVRFLVIIIHKNPQVQVQANTSFGKNKSKKLVKVVQKKENRHMIIIKF